jgi:chorismate dehydratase
LKKIKVGIVNYLNTKPLLYGISHSPGLDSIELVEDHPAKVASFLARGEIDIGLVPVAILPALKDYQIYTDFCIGCDGPVASVCLFSEVPIQEVNTVLLDYQSRTSVALFKILAKNHWKISPQYLDTQSEYRTSIYGRTAGLVIGDRSFEQRRISPYVYDLGEAWKQYTGLPFVFAAWTATKSLDATFIEVFNAANRLGVQNISTVIKELNYPLFNMEEYFSKYISYELNPPKEQGLEQFLSLLDINGSA